MNRKRKRSSSINEGSAVEQPFPVNDLPEEILVGIFDFVAPRSRGSFRVILMSVCRKWKRVARSSGPLFHPPLDLGSFCESPATETGLALLFDASRFGYCDLYQLALSWLPLTHRYCKFLHNRAMRAASAGGQLRTFRMAKRLGADDFERALLASAEFGKRQTFTAAWYAYGENRLDSQRMALLEMSAAKAARFGRRNIVRFCLEMLVKKSSHNVIGPTCDTVIIEAAKEGHVQICEDLRNCGARDVVGIIEAGSRNGHIAVCDLAIKWGQPEWTRSEAPELMLFGGAVGGHEHVCMKAIDVYGACDFERMLVAGVIGANLNICVLARRFGARNLSEMFARAIAYDYHDLAEKAREWISEGDQK